MFFKRFVNKLNAFLLGYGEISESDLEACEELLLQADVGVGLSDEILTLLRTAVHEKRFPHKDQLLEQIKSLLVAQLKFAPLDFQSGRTNVYFMVGVNGVGKTTTLAKLAAYLKREHHVTPLLVAADTFRAGAIAQLTTWGDRLGMPTFHQAEGADPAAVVFDAMQSAKQRGIGAVLIDTAGRLHTKAPLMDELKKISRVMQRVDATTPHETLLVLDATVGQNGLAQAKFFHEAVPLTGVVVTKLDGSAKGGVIFSIQQALRVPIKFVGLGEQLTDLQVFSPDHFVELLLEEN